MPKKAKPLEEYHRKRDFGKTAEPAGKAAKASARDEQRPRVFVIQKHDATRLHYDLRLEVEGVLKSWAVPKGPSLNPSDKRLAVMTEDHPLEYGKFEGTIPEGEYGAGAVIVWDGGTYRNLKLEDPDHEPLTMAEALESGHVTVWLEGQKLQGGFALIRTRMGRKGGGDDGNDNWLLIKMADEQADPKRDVTKEEPGSILSDATIESLSPKQ
jgi:DNA ligase D-like protein (predicted 3'-phosphoesterase)